MHLLFLIFSIEFQECLQSAKLLWMEDIESLAYFWINENYQDFVKKNYSAFLLVLQLLLFFGICLYHKDVSLL